MNTPEAVRLLAQTLNDKTHQVELRVSAARGLGRAGNTAARIALADVIKDSAELLEVRAAAAEALGDACHRA